MEWSDFCACFDSIDSCFMNFAAEDQARRAKLKVEAERIIAAKDRPAAKGSGGKSGLDGPERTAESADAMMAMLLAEEATEKRKKTVGTDRHKSSGGKKLVKKGGTTGKK
jgi:hypothetical protein